MFKRLLIILLFTGTYIFSQGQKSKIYGKVVDDLTGEVIIGATVKIEGTKLGAVTDAKGKYVIINVQPGTYNLVVTSIGYAKTTIKEIEAVVDRSVEVNIRLKQQTMQMQAVEVTAEREKIIKDQTSTSSTITQEQIKAAPVEGVRGIIDLSTSFQKNERGDYQVRGSGTNEVNFQINGMEQTNSSQSLPGLGTGTKANNSWKYDVNPLGVQQIQMITGGFSPEYGNAQAAIIKVVMKEGGPKFNGEVKVEYRGPGQYHYGPYIYDKNNSFEWQKWGKFEYWQDLANKAINSPENNILTQLGISQNHPTLYNAVIKNKNATPEQKAKFDSIVARELQWGYNTWYKLHNPSDDNPLGVYDYRKRVYTRYMWGVGGPVGKNPDLLKFYFSGEYRKNPTRIMSTEKDQIYQNYVLSLTSTIIPNHKFKLTGTYQKYVGGLFSGSSDIRWAGTNSLTYKYFVTRDPVRTELTLAQSFNWVYTINNRSYIETFITHQSERYILPSKALLTWNDEADRADSANDKYGILLKRGDWWQNNIFTYYENISTDYFQDNRADVYTVSSDYVNQIDDANLIKLGYKLSYSDLQNTGVTYNFLPNALVSHQGFAERYKAFPIQFAGYVQDKLEFEGMVANFGVRVEGFNFQYRAPYDRFNIFYPGENGATRGDIRTRKTTTKVVVLPRLGLSFPVNEVTAFRLYYGHFASMPTYSQALSNGTYFGWNTYGNPDLDFKKTINFEFGVQQMLTDRDKIDVALYYNDRANQIGSQRVAAYSGSTSISGADDDAGYDNTGKKLYFYDSYANNSFSSTIGIEVTLERIAISDWRWRLSYSLSQTMDGRYGSPYLYPENSNRATIREVTTEQVSYYDRTHSFRALVQYVLGDNRGFQLFGVKPFENSEIAMTYSVQSGLPFTYYTDFSNRYVVNNRRYPLETQVDLNFVKNLTIFGYRVIMGVRVMNLFDNKWLTPISNYKEYNVETWLKYSQTLDKVINPRTDETVTSLAVYRTYRNIPRQIFFTLGVGF